MQQPPAQAHQVLPSSAVTSLHMLGIGFPLAYGLHHIANETFFIGLLLVIASICGIFCLIRHLQKRDAGNYLTIYIMSLGAALLLVSYYHGYRGLIFTFPYMACLFYFLSFKHAVIISIFFCISCLILALFTTDFLVVSRYGAALSISVGFAVCYAYIVNQQKIRLEKDANYDALTGITNRRQFINWLDSLYADKKLTSKNLALFYIDIDDFKYVNDHYDHATGDALLKAFSERILAVIRQSELIVGSNKIYNFARIAGDEFIIAILDLDTIESAKKIAERLTESASYPFILKGAELHIHISVGVVYSDKEMDAEKLLHNADITMYRAKKSGKNTFYIYDDSISKEVARKKDIEDSISTALEKNQFSLAYMPIYDISTASKIAGIEVLLRNKVSGSHASEPDKFIPIAEASGQIREIDQWVLENTFKQISQTDSILENKGLWCAINISSTELLDAKFIARITALAHEHNINPQSIHLEITETKLVPYENIIIDRLNQLRELQFHLTLDDYGTGYTGFAQLLKFPGDYIKIDRSFVAEIDNNNSNYRKMIGVMLSIAKIYGLKVIAEGVETEAQLQYLKELGCHYAQGYYFSKPVDWPTLNQLISH